MKWYGKLWKKGKLNSKKMGEIWKEIVKWYGNYRRKVSWKVKRFGQYRRQVTCIVKRLGKYDGKVSLIVKRFGK